jgi:D-glycero-beta-D-manno-heptose-7-phosphate kinase
LSRIFVAMNQIQTLFSSFSKKRVLIVGDVMIDSYIIGKVERVSPEAPVPVVDVTGFDQRLGGAGNVALNVKAMGATPILCTVVGHDKERTFMQRFDSFRQTQDHQQNKGVGK